MRRLRTVTAGLVMAVGISTVSAGLAGSALAAPARPAATGVFKTWPTAQKAAGFQLLKPANTYGLPRALPIAVARCPAGHGVRKGTRLVRALYANFSVGRILEILQDNSRHLCVQLPKTKFIAKVHIDGATARLSRWCGVQGIPSCKSHVQILVLTWVKKGRSYLAISEGVRRAHIIGFARSLVRVR